jgi:deoxyhypusine synthase
MRRGKKLEEVKDFHAPESDDIVALVDGMGRGGGFMAKSFAEAAMLLYEMTRERNYTGFLSLVVGPSQRLSSE